MEEKETLFTFDMFIYDTEKNFYEYLTNRHFYGSNEKDAIYEAVKWIEKTYNDFNSLEWVIGRNSVMREGVFFINGKSINEYI